MEKRVVIKEQSLINLAEAVRDKAGTSELYDIDEIVEVTKTLGTPELEELNATENGEYKPKTYGFSKVTVDVQPPREEITITKAGTYIPTTYGFSKVIADIPSRNFEEEVF